MQLVARPAGGDGGPPLGRRRHAGAGLHPRREDRDLRVAVGQARAPRTTSASAARWRSAPTRTCPRTSAAVNRAARSASPASWAWARASSGWPSASNHVAARECSSATATGPPRTELAVEELAEQVVVAVAVAGAVERDDQQVVALQRLEHVLRPGPGEHGVAQRTGHPVEDRRAGQERHRLDRQAGEHLGADVVGEQPVVAAERHAGGQPLTPGVEGQRGQVQPDRPPLGALDERGDLGVVEVDVARPRAGPGPRRRPSPGRRRRSPSRRPGPATGPAAAVARRATRWPGGHPAGRLAANAVDGVEAGDVVEQLEVVDHDDERRRSRRPAPGVIRIVAVVAGSRLADTSGRNVEPPSSSSSAAGQVAQEDHGIVVGLVDGQPHDRVLGGRRPLGEQRRLAVAGRRDDGEDRCRRARAGGRAHVRARPTPSRIDDGRRDAPGWFGWRARVWQRVGRHAAPLSAGCPGDERDVTPVQVRCTVSWSSGGRRAPGDAGDPLAGPVAVRDRDPRLGVADLGDGVLPVVLAGAAHHEQVAAAEVERQRPARPAAPGPQPQRPRRARR